ncbi:MAG TPA: hypothetical protein VLK65_24235 [Vicinamibacteria bacterium]|nr:hypothetical protein [Vicinamibacteria bacterium]
MVARLGVAALVAAATVAVYAGRRSVEVDFERGYEGGFVDGFHPRERAEGKYFRWTDGSSFVVFRNLPPRGLIAVEARLKTIRPVGEALPELRFTANGITVHRARALPGSVTYHFELPSATPTLRLGIESDTFEASGGRILGVQVLGVTLKPAERPTWTMPALTMFLAAFGFTLALGSSLAALVLCAGCLYLLAQGPAAFTSFPLQLAGIAVVAVVVSKAARFVADRLTWLQPVERARVVALVAALVAVEAIGVCYPLRLSSDADFQGNRMSELLRGNWHPTSVTQHDAPFRIPYPVSLYVAAAPLVGVGLDRVTALEFTTALFDVLVSVALVILAWLFFDDVPAGAFAAVLYQLVPMNVSAFSAGNWTNLFAASMLAMSFLFLLLASVREDSRFVAATGLTTFAALTAHFGMLIEGLLLWPLWLLGASARVRLAVLLGFVLAGIYYLGYWELVSSQWGRSVEGEASTGAYDLALVGEQLGWVFCLTSVLGAFPVVRRFRESPFHTAATSWLAVTGVFLVIELVTPIGIRYWLQALPILALLSGRYLSRALDRGRFGKVAAWAAFAYMCVIGLANLREMLLFRYH